MMSKFTSSIGLSIDSKKSKVLRINKRNEAPILLGETALEEVESFTYLGSIVSKNGGVEPDVAAHVGKARAAWWQLKTVCYFGDL